MAEQRESSELIEKVVEVKRVSKVVKGGRRFSFSALVIIGDGKGRVGAGLGKANEVVEAVRKGNEAAKKNMVSCTIYKTTIPHAVQGKHGSSLLMMKPSPSGSGIISAGAVRAVMECVGIHDVNVKALGSRNANNMVSAALDGLAQLKSLGEVAARRGKNVEGICQIGF